MVFSDTPVLLVLVFFAVDTVLSIDLFLEAAERCVRESSALNSIETATW